MTVDHADPEDALVAMRNICRNGLCVTALLVAAALNSASVARTRRGGGFEVAEHIRFTEHLIADGFEYAYGISAFDIDGDGALDLVAADTGVGLCWFENDGKGNFTRHVIHTQKGEWLERHTVVDINQDGRPEIVIVDNLGGSVLWFEYDGDPREQQSWRRHYICDGGLPGAYDVAVADFDGDGALDVAASSWRKGNQFVWFENKGGSWVKHVIEEDIAETRTICAADLGGSGRPDLVGTARVANQVVWYENTGELLHKPWVKHVIDTSPIPVHGHPVDMDGDGDLDVVMALGAWGPEDPEVHQIVWYENKGDPREELWEKHVICQPFMWAFEAIAADLDGDGNIEVVASNWGKGGRIVLFKHDGDPRGVWTPQVLKSNWVNADQVIVADLDGDGRLDIVAVAERGSNELRWWRNDGPSPNTSVTVARAVPASQGAAREGSASRPAATPAPPDAVYRLGSRVELFVDDELIDRIEGLSLRLRTPRLAEVAVRLDRAYEDSTLYDPVVILDGECYRMWYRTNFNGKPFYTGYAESADGVHWTKPSLGLIEYEGSKDNNLVWSSAMGSGDPRVLSIFKDAHPQCRDDERYKAVCVVTGGGKLTGLRALLSPDGFRWRPLREEAVVTQGAFDSHNIALYDASRGYYAAYYRDFVNGVRHIRRATSADFVTWEHEGVIDLGDTPVEHLYKNAATPYYRRPDLIFMFPKRFLPRRSAPGGWPHSGLSDIVFMSSRDGVRFQRTFPEAFVRPGRDARNWHERAIEVGPGLVPTGDGEMSFYLVQNYRTDSVHIRRAVLRQDGIASLHAGSPGGEMVTRPFTFEGGRLSVNVATSAAGHVRFELQSAEGSPLPGFELDSCPEIYGDELERVVAWDGGADAGEHAGKPVRLRIAMVDADLFSFRFLD